MRYVRFLLLGLLALAVVGERAGVLPLLAQESVITFRFTSTHRCPDHISSMVIEGSIPTKDPTLYQVKATWSASFFDGVQIQGTNILNGTASGQNGYAVQNDPANPGAPPGYYKNAVQGNPQKFEALHLLAMFVLANYPNVPPVPPGALTYSGCLLLEWTLSYGHSFAPGTFDIPPKPPEFGAGTPDGTWQPGEFGWPYGNAVELMVTRAEIQLRLQVSEGTTGIEVIQQSNVNLAWSVSPGIGGIYDDLVFQVSLINPSKWGFVLGSITAANAPATPFLLLAVSTLTISGTISYDGTASGPIGVAVYSDAGFSNKVAQVNLEALGNYNIPGLKAGTYYLRAFRDSNGNGAPDGNEPVYLSKTGLEATSDISNLNFTLLDPAVRPVIRSVTRTQQTVAVTSTAVKGHTYALEHKNALQDATWTQLDATVAQDRMITLLDSAVADVTRRFYRVAVLSASGL